ncbi:MAG: hypothetical protein CM15mP102_04360 [Flavobacteriales bacterium]|nr:MAG: hypothetical protein CM15mP102_04360 [Flavobacteriales bacterium]
MIGGEDKSYKGMEVSYVNAFRHQRLINEGSKYGVFTTNRYFREGGYGNLIGIDGLLHLTQYGDFNLNFLKVSIKNQLQIGLKVRKHF